MYISNGEYFSVHEFRMVRKLRLSVYRKNQYRKKREKKRAALSLHLADSECSTLVLPVSLPISFYFGATASTIVSLLDRIKKTSVLPRGTYLYSCSRKCALIKVLLCCRMGEHWRPCWS